MRVIYPVKITQIFLFLVCSYLLVRNRTICYEKPGFDISEGVEHVLNTLEPKNCENYLIATTEFLTLLGGNEPVKIEVETSKTTTEPVKNDVIGHDETTTVVTNNHVTMNIQKMENVTIVMKQSATKSADEKKLAGNETIEEEVAEKKAYLFERPNTFPYELYGNRSTKSIKGCIDLTRGDMVTHRNGVTWDILSCSSAVLVILAFILSAETAYAFFTGNEFSQTGSRVTASVHIVLDLTVAVLLYVFRAEWDTKSAFNYGETMLYPCGWKCVELFAWLVAVSHLLEVIFYRVVNGCIVFVSRMSSYNVADREMENFSNSGYIRPRDEPFDGSNEW